MMSLQAILPQQAAQVLNCFHQKLSWKIKEEQLRLDKTLFLQLDTKIPGTGSSKSLNNLGGCVLLLRGGYIAFMTQWPKGVDIKNIRLDALFNIKISDGSSVSIKCDEISRNEDEHGGYTLGVVIMHIMHIFNMWAT